MISLQKTTSKKELVARPVKGAGGALLDKVFENVLVEKVFPDMDLQTSAKDELLWANAAVEGLQFGTGSFGFHLRR